MQQTLCNAGRTPYGRRASCNDYASGQRGDRTENRANDATGRCGCAGVRSDDAAKLCNNTVQRGRRMTGDRRECGGRKTGKKQGRSKDSARRKRGETAKKTGKSGEVGREKRGEGEGEGVGGIGRILCVLGGRRWARSGEYPLNVVWNICSFAYIVV